MRVYDMLSSSILEYDLYTLAATNDKTLWTDMQKQG